MLWHFSTWFLLPSSFQKEIFLIFVVEPVWARTGKTCKCVGPLGYWVPLDFYVRLAHAGLHQFVNCSSSISLLILVAAEVCGHWFLSRVLWFSVIACHSLQFCRCYLPWNVCFSAGLRRIVNFSGCSAFHSLLEQSDYFQFLTEHPGNWHSLIYFF